MTSGSFRSSYRPARVAVLFFLVVALFFYGSLVWTGVISMTSSKLLPVYNFVGFDQYSRLWSTDRWIVSLVNMVIFGVLYVVVSMALGIFLAILLDRNVRGEGVFRAIFLYPFAVSLVVTGLAWRWIFEPAQGVQAIMRGFGFESFAFDWLSDPERAIYTLVIAGVWHSVGFAMIIVLAGLRGIGSDLWKAIRVEGIPLWRGYLQIILPSLWPVVASAVVLLASDVIRAYDLVITLTKGGPGFASDLPAKFAVDHFFGRANIGFASAASILMMLLVVAMLVPYFWAEYRAQKK
ncbi:MAG TPA: sugar ABC transporter permease [Amaricoccus sp.]|uniref:carbohydrate ABC transporter permease n=1 Tax=Amaricoccus sp. TaxID=1872485 RepID=UPI002BE9DF18|nr:sugar ABC transporter permease [Amaricoccus sp.]HMQ94123.1 sugar ABC transporter permease [Amaricoccus sp.]HMR53007.1 sugar ABC transporter permease [Amaricoccus sp.]HMR59132.1 sugar ABC transporter permease [Amaricoccus sp.]HMT99939.1 sugar ABC transporter permease [Amaricoccus sp.]